MIVLKKGGGAAFHRFALTMRAHILFIYINCVYFRLFCYFVNRMFSTIQQLGSNFYAESTLCCSTACSTCLGFSSEGAAAAVAVTISVAW